MKYSLSFRLKSYITWLFDKTIGISNVKLRIRLIAAQRILRRENGSKYESNDADIIIWSYYPDAKLERVCYVWDILLMAAVAASGRKFMVYRKKDIERFHNKTILYSLNKDRFDYLGFENYALAHQHISKLLEGQGNKVYPRYHDVLYWENKEYMYSKFMELGLSTPRTVFYHSFNDIVTNEHKFPFLIKVLPHQGAPFQRILRAVQYNRSSGAAKHCRRSYYPREQDLHYTGASEHNHGHARNNRRQPDRSSLLAQEQRQIKVENNIHQQR
jgi:hypothetical protein